MVLRVDASTDRDADLLLDGGKRARAAPQSPARRARLRREEAIAGWCASAPHERGLDRAARGHLLLQLLLRAARAVLRHARLVLRREDGACAAANATV